MAKKDACYHKVKSRYKKWPSAYATGALVKCRKVGATNWGTGGKKTKKSWRSVNPTASKPGSVRTRARGGSTARPASPAGGSRPRGRSARTQHAGQPWPSARSPSPNGRPDQVVSTGKGGSDLPQVRRATKERGEAAFVLRRSIQETRVPLSTCDHGAGRHDHHRRQRSL